MAGNEDEGWRIPTGLPAPSGLQPSPGLTPPSDATAPELSSWDGYASDALSEALQVDPAIPESSVVASVPEAPAPAPAPVLPTAPDAAVSAVAAAQTTSTPAAIPPPPTAPPPPAAPPAPAATGIGQQKKKSQKASGIIGVAVVVVAAAIGFGSIAGDDDPEDFTDSVTEDPASASLYFFDLLRSDDPESALALLDGSDSSRTDILPLPADMSESGGIEDIQISESWEDGEQAGVTVAYTLGGVETSTLLTLAKYEGAWVITDGATAVPESDILTNFPATINGEPLSDGVPALLPGEYELGFDTSALELDAEEQRFMIRPDGSGEAQPIAATPLLTASGSEQFTSALYTSLTECLDVGTASTPCGMNLDLADLPKGYELDGDLTRTLSPGFDEVIAAHSPELEQRDGAFTGQVILPTEFSAEIQLQVKRTTDGEIRTGHMRDPEPSFRPSADTAGFVGYNLAVSWRDHEATE